MSQINSRNSYLKTISIAVACFSAIATPVKAQLVPDNTLGNESSRVERVNSIRDNITGGATRGTNLFHSFQEFNINVGREVYFVNPTGIQNIINRVTGGNVSEIFGTLGVNGNANLYLINPNGIVFGNGARLDINGTFIGTTADGVRLGTNDVYSATNPASSNLLTIQPGALFVNRFGNRLRTITNQGNLSANTRQNITLSADVINNFGVINVPGGNLFLEAVNGDLNTGNISVDLPSGQAGNINLTASGNINVNNRSFITSAGVLGGNITIETPGNLIANEAVIRSFSLGNVIGKGGDINVTASNIQLNSSILDSISNDSVDTGNITINADNVSLIDGGVISTLTRASGKGGDVTITANNIQVNGASPLDSFISGIISDTFLNEAGLRSASRIAARTRGSGNAGNITIDTNSFGILDGGVISASTSSLSSGKGGNITITARQEIEVAGINNVRPTASNGIFAETFGAGNAGDLTINTDFLSVRDGAGIETNTFLNNGNAGNLTVTAREIEIIGVNAIINNFSEISSVSDFGGAGKTGNITINTDRLRLLDGTRISTFTGRTNTPPNAGNITITATDSIELININPNNNDNSAIFSQTLGVTNAGNLSINTDRLRLLNGAQINTSTLGEGAGGNLTISAQNIELIGRNPNDNSRSGLFSSATDRFADGTGTGDGGKITITTDRLTILDGATISASNFQSANLRPPGLGRAGNIEINANRINLNRGQITASGNIRGGGDIDINTNNFILLENGSEISTDVGENQEFPGGNLNINSPLIIASPDNNRITATAETTSGGNINLNTNAILGFPQFLTIDASSRLGIDGTVNISGLSDELTQGDLLTPTTPIDANAIMANDICKFKDGEIARGSSFTIPGKGGIRENPLETVDRRHNNVEWSNRSDRGSQINQNRSARKPRRNSISTRNIQENSPKKTISPAVGWYRRKDGAIVLTDDPTKVRPLNQPVDYLPGC